MRPILILTLTLTLLPATALAKEKPKDKPEKTVADDLFTGPVPNLRIEIPPEGVETLRRYHQVWRQTRPERIDVRATVREADGRTYSDVAVHLKGSFSFQPFDAKPSLTLNFDKFVPGRRFHGLTKIHLNNAVQDSTALCEQFARELYKEQGIIAPRATPALLHLNGRDFGLCVLVEGANKSFLRRNFGAAAAKGNLYDGGSGGDVTKDLGVVAGEHPDDRSDLQALVDAAKEVDPARRLAALEKVLDVDEFIAFAAIEALLVHWDGYAMGCNNYHVFHDAARDKLVFLPHGMDQLYGTSSTPSLSLTPVFRGTVAKALFAIPEAREKYLKKIDELSKKPFAVETLHAHVDRLARRLLAALSPDQRPAVEDAVLNLKMGITQRAASIAQQLKAPPKSMRFAKEGVPVQVVAAWRFKSDSTYTARATRARLDRKEIMGVTGNDPGERTGTAAAGGTWRAGVLLEAGHYEFTGLARTRGATADPQGPAVGAMLRISGETRTDFLTTANDDWKTLTYSFDVTGLEQVELVCEFRGPAGAVCEFDTASLALTRKPLNPDTPPAPRLDPKLLLRPRLTETP
jgi:hypothetical protein